MDSASLLAAIEDALPQARRMKVEADEADEARRRESDAVGINVPVYEAFPDLLACLAALLTPGGHVLTPGGAWGALRPGFVAPLLMGVALERGPTEAVTWLTKFLTTTRSSVRLVTEVRGVAAPPGGLRVGDVDFCPWLGQPDSPTSLFLQRSYGAYAIPMPPPPPPSVAILTMPDIQVGGSPKEMGDPERQLRVDQARAAVVRTMLALTAVLDGPWSTGRAWVDFVDPDLQAAGFGYSWMASIREAPDPFGAAELSPAHATFANGYLALRGDFSRKVDIASTRLNLARRKLQLGDKAVETSIALEALLGDDNFDLSYKLRLRAALLIGGNAAERREVMDTIKAFYTVRSKVVHGKEPSANPNSASTVSRAVEICAAIIRRLVEYGRAPDWPSFELSGGDLG